MKEAPEAGMEGRATWAERAEKEQGDGARNKTALDPKGGVGPKDRTTRQGVGATSYARVPCP